jgi:diguanylate cyclase (GGDEF)-like protein
VAVGLLPRGAECFVGRRPADRWHAMLLVLAVAGLALAVHGRQMPWVVVATSLSLGWSMLRTAALLLGGLRSSLGMATALAAALPLALLGAVFFVRGLLAPWLAAELGQPISVPTAPLAFNVHLGLFVVGAMLVLNFGLAAPVIVRLVRRLQHLSHHDELTGVLNRRGMREHLELARERRLRQGEGYALLAIDIDHFKKVNDQHGHSRGDAALVAVAKTLKRAAREVDRVGRMGGEEFCVLLPASDTRGARQAAQRLLDAVRSEAHVAAGLPQPLTVSVGLAAAGEAQETTDELLRRVDAALYRAKAGGRDRAEVALEASAAA